MALDATLGGADSNSYVTLDEAIAYFEDRMHSSAWDDNGEKEKVLISSSKMLDWYVKWKGYKSSSEQSMQWPRMSVTRRDGSSVDNDIIPNDVKTAVFELALSSLAEDRTADNPLAGIEQVKAGSLMVKADNGDVDSTAADAIPEKIWKILSDLYSQGNGMSVVRLMRA